MIRINENGDLEAPLNVTITAAELKAAYAERGMVVTDATKHEQMARAVLEDYDEWAEMPQGAMGTAESVRYGSLARSIERSTNKHPSDWTRDGLMEYLGVRDE